MKKKVFSIILASIMVVSSLAGCGSASQENNQVASDDTTSQSSGIDEASDNTTDSKEENDTETSNGKTLVVYYSATGTTKAVAQKIAHTTGGDLFEIQPKEPYTDADLNWTDSDSRVSREHENEDERKVELVSTMVDDWDSYDTVFIGYPIWWGIAAWPVDGFVAANDFTGKTVIPFCTSASSGIGDSGNLLEKMAGTGDWKEGHRFNGGADEADVSAWVKELD